MSRKMITLILTLVIVVATAIVNFVAEPSNKIEVVTDSTKTDSILGMRSDSALVKDSVKIDSVK